MAELLLLPVSWVISFIILFEKLLFESFWLWIVLLVAPSGLKVHSWEVAVPLFGLG